MSNVPFLQEFLNTTLNSSLPPSCSRTANNILNIDFPDSIEKIVYYVHELLVVYTKYATKPFHFTTVALVHVQHQQKNK